MIVNTTRFGQLEIPEDRVITMVKPILGFEGMTTFCLVEQDDVKPFLCLQSTQDPAVAFLVVNPVLFYSDYRIKVNPKEIADLSIDRFEMVETYVIATMSTNPHKVTVNLQGPLLINTDNRLAKQVVLVNSKYQVDHDLLEAIDQLEKVSDKPELVGA